MDNEKKTQPRNPAPQPGQASGSSRRRRRRGSGNGPRPEQAGVAPRQGGQQSGAPRQNGQSNAPRQNGQGNAPRQGGRPARNIRTENAAPANQQRPAQNAQSNTQNNAQPPRPRNNPGQPRQGQNQQASAPAQGGRRPRRGNGNAPAPQASQQRPARRTPPPAPQAPANEDPGLLLISRRPPKQKFYSFEEYLEARGGVSAPLPPEPQETDIGHLRYVALSGEGEQLAQPDDEIVPSVADKGETR